MATSILAVEGGAPVRAQERAPHYPFPASVKADLAKVIDDEEISGWYGGPRSHELERAFVDYFGVRFAIAVNSGTSALHVAYVAAGLRPGDRFIVQANAYVSAVSAGVQHNALPLFADVDEHFVLDARDVERRITPRTRMVVPVHLYGQSVDMELLMATAARHNLIVIEDCGQSIGATFGGKKLGTFGQAAAFSLCCRKHVTCGEGGMVLTNDPQIADRARKLVWRGKSNSWLGYEMLGYSYGMTDLQAVLGLHGIRRVDDEVQRRSRHAEIFRRALRGTDIAAAEPRASSTHAWFKMPLLLPAWLAPHRDWFVEAVKAEGFRLDLPHPPLYSLPWIAERRGHDEVHPWRCPELIGDEPVEYGTPDCPVTESLSPRVVAAETGPGLDSDDIAAAATALRKVHQVASSRWGVAQVPGEIR